MIILVDVDNVCCNLQEVVTNLFNERHGTNYTLSDFTDYDIMNVLPTNEAIDMINMYGESGLYDLVKPIAGAHDALQKMINAGHQVYMVTDAVPRTYGEKVEFIKRYFSFIDDSHIVCMKHKWMFKADIMIEDNLSTLLAKPYYHRICLDYPWNQSDKDYWYDIHRCGNWNEIAYVVNKLSAEE